MYDDDKIKALKTSIENTEAKLREVVQRHTNTVTMQVPSNQPKR